MAPAATVSGVDLDFDASVRDESARFAAALAGVDPAAPVPSCPDWTAADLVWHLAEVQLFWGVIVRDRLSSPAPSRAAKPPRPAAHDELLELGRSTSAGMVDALAGAADEEHVWTWFEADQSVRFVRRRQAHEALIHRVDAELTAGTVGAVDPALATDGIAEVLEWMFSYSPAWATHAQDGPTGRIATTDTGREWMVRVGHLTGTEPESGTVYTDEPTLTILAEGSPTFEISGSAGDLDLWLWNRPVRGVVTRLGDHAAFDALVASGVQ